MLLPESVWFSVGLSASMTTNRLWIIFRKSGKPWDRNNPLDFDGKLDRFPEIFHFSTLQNGALPVGTRGSHVQPTDGTTHLHQVVHCRSLHSFECSLVYTCRRFHKSTVISMSNT